MRCTLDPAMIRFFEKEIKKFLEENSRLEAEKNVARPPTRESILFDPFMPFKADICFSVGCSAALAFAGEYTNIEDKTSILWRSALCHIDMDFMDVPLTMENTEGRLLFSVFSYDKKGKRSLLNIFALLPSALFPIIANIFSGVPVKIDYCYDPDFSKKGKPLAREKDLGFVPLYVWRKFYRERFNSE